MDLLNFIFILFSLLAIAILCFYFLGQAKKDKEEWLKKEIKSEKEEKEAEEWLHHSFVPQILSFIKQRPKKIVKYTFFVLLMSVFLWSFFAEGLWIAARNSFLTCVIYAFTILYIYLEPRFFILVKENLPRKMRHRFDNDWIRAYIFFLPPALIIYFFIRPISLLSFLFIYSGFFLCLVTATRISADIGKEEENERKKIAKKILDGSDR